MVEPVVDPDAWRTEQERVAPRLANAPAAAAAATAVAAVSTSLFAGVVLLSSHHLLFILDAPDVFFGVVLNVSILMGLCYALFNHG